MAVDSGLGTGIGDWLAAAETGDVREEEGQYDDGSYPWWVEYFGIDKSFFHDDWEEEVLEENEDSVDELR